MDDSRLIIRFQRRQDPADGQMRITFFLFQSQNTAGNINHSMFPVRGYFSLLPAQVSRPKPDLIIFIQDPLIFLPGGDTDSLFRRFPGQVLNALSFLRAVPFPVFLR